MKRINTERRRYPRIEQKLPVKIAANGYDFITTTDNVSCVGAYCHVDKYIPPFTKIMIKFSLPLASDAANCDSDVDCKGVVVRTDDKKSGGFNIAIFFNEIKDNQRQKISQYIKHLLSGNPFRSSNKSPP